MSGLIRKLSVPKAKTSADIEKISASKTPGSTAVDSSKSRAPKPDKQPVTYQLQPPEPKLRHRRATLSTTAAVIVPSVTAPIKNELDQYNIMSDLQQTKKFIAEQQKLRVEREALQRASALHQEVYKKKVDASWNGLRPKSPIKNRR